MSSEVSLAPSEIELVELMLSMLLPQIHKLKKELLMTLLISEWVNFLQEVLKS